MKLMYVACNPRLAPDLDFELEVTQLQRLINRTKGEMPQLLSYPRLYIDEFLAVLNEQKPDILHISAHGEHNQLALANTQGTPSRLTGKRLCKYLNIEKPPKLVYLSACNSRAIAEEVSSVVRMAIGIKATVLDDTARSVAITFYERLFAGDSVHNAFEASQATLELLEDNRASARLFSLVDARKERMHHLPRLIAQFHQGDTKPDRDGYFDVEIGVTGCPGSTWQMLFFTDDETLMFDDDANDLCSVVRSSPERTTIWSEEVYNIMADYRLFAVGVTAGGELFSVTSTLCEALTDYLRFGNSKRVLSQMPRDVLAAIARLQNAATWEETPTAKVHSPKTRSRRSPSTRIGKKKAGYLTALKRRKKR